MSPAYKFDPTQPVFALQPGRPAEAFGAGRAGFTAYVTNESLTSNVGTYSLKLINGPVPVVGQSFFVNATSPPLTSPPQNVQSVITAVSGFNTLDNSTGTISAAITGTNVGSVTTGGLVTGMPYHAPETLVVGKSQAFAIRNYFISWSYACPSVPSTIAVQLEGSLTNVDSDFVIIGTSQTTAGGVDVVATVPSTVNFVRLNCTATSGGTLPSIVAKIMAA
jgi:hypothetical protein